MVLWATYTVSFVVLYRIPGDAVLERTRYEPTDITAEQMNTLRAEYGLDQSLVSQYLHRTADVLTGDLGRSLVNGRPVVELIGEALPWTLQIAGLALVVGLFFGAGLALLANYVQAGWLRQALLSLPPLGVAVPSFWLGLVLLQIFSFRITWFPATGHGGWRTMALPAITLAIPIGAQIAQVFAKSLEQALAETYIQTARAKGLGHGRILVGHATRNATLPALTIFGLVVGDLFAGSVIIETVFSRNGIGQLTAASISAQDMPVVQGLVLLAAIVYVLVNLAVDLTYPLLDPRVARLSRPVPSGA
ncbi:ABC transporter permease [Frankia sp. QA3]|uniref:ABC transporter permease n=1 Tax=Frankia sp. QA3 TaxID=710111 RepID=UPI0002E249AE|nr:ABC transporter permease [Frankia sp. QA3]